METPVETREVTVESAQKAFHLYAMAPKDRETVRNALDSGIVDMNVSNIVNRSIEKTEEKLESRGLTLPEYEEAYNALKTGDYTKAKEIAERAREKINERHRDIRTQSTFQENSVSNGDVQELSDERKALHKQIVDDELSKVPEAEDPHVLFLVGPPGAGKSRARKVYMETYGDAIFTDPDAFRFHLVPHYDAASETHMYRTHREAGMVSDLLYENLLESKRNGVYEGTLRNLEAYQADMQKAFDHRAKVDVVLIDTDAAECWRRAIAFRERGTALHVLMGSLQAPKNFKELLSDSRISTMEIINNNVDKGEAYVAFRKTKEGDIMGMEYLDSLVTKYEGV